MSEVAQEIRMVPIAAINVLNPRARNKKVFNEIVTSIANLGLKKPITVARRDDGGTYDLVCGQGRLEAFVALGQIEIPAVVIEASKEDCFIMSLAENVARRQHSPLELMREIGALRKRGYSISEIAAKTDFSSEYVHSICSLLERGEERLLVAVEKGTMPHSIAMEISRAKDGDIQQALADAYETKTLPGNQISAIRKIVEIRNALGKSMQATRPANQRPPSKKVTADALVRAYRKEAERQRLLVRKASLANSRLLFIVKALRKLLSEDHFVTLLRAEQLHSVPTPLADRLGLSGGR